MIKVESVKNYLRIRVSRICVSPVSRPELAEIEKLYASPGTNPVTTLLGWVWSSTTSPFFCKTGDLMLPCGGYTSILYPSMLPSGGVQYKTHPYVGKSPSVSVGFKNFEARISFLRVFKSFFKIFYNIL